MFVIVVEYRYTTPLVLTARTEKEARERVTLLQNERSHSERRATVYQHIPGGVTAGHMKELFNVTFETVAG